jgi:hypothetical protein
MKTRQTVALTEPLQAGPADRCVAVVGMHRSGTSATAGLLVSLGLKGPQGEDLISANRANEAGHWESKGMHELNARLMREVGATGLGPPDVTPRWDVIPQYAEIQDQARHWFASTYAGGQVMVKDPRLCSTLSFWRQVLPAPMAAVFVLRNPLEVARSLQARNNVPMTLALANWDRYNRSAAMLLEGLPTLVVEYATMMRDPARAIDQISMFMEQLGIDVTPDRREAAASHLDATLRHQRAEDDEFQELAEVQLEVFGVLSAMRGPHESWRPPSLPPPQLWVDDMLQLRRNITDKVRALRRMKSLLPNRIRAQLGRLTLRS